ncbi:MAG: class I SAM-dependent methyltransferase [Candidatus Hodarchaeota archaeon]
MDTRYSKERDIFNRIASKKIVNPMEKSNLDRYASPKWPHLFPKEMLFSLAGDLSDKKVLELGCGEGIEAVQLAYCGAEVTGIDISDVSIKVAQERAAIQGFDIKFRNENFVESESLESEYYDIIWCNLILHHLVDALDIVMQKIERALKPAGMFISREPNAYAKWLKRIRKLFPIETTDPNSDEQPLRSSEFLIIKKYFPGLCIRHFRILARADLLTNNLPIIRFLARADNLLLSLPGSSALAGDVVMWARKT